MSSGEQSKQIKEQREQGMVRKKIWKVIDKKRFNMISMTDITKEEALHFVRGKWPMAEVL